MAIPDSGSTAFDVTKHGFNFDNEWTGQQILIDIPYIGQTSLGNTQYGLCGGMIISALDTFFAGGVTPDQPQVPVSGTPMRSYIYGRQQDTFRDDNAFMIRRLLDWVPKPIETTGITGLRVLSDRQFRRIIVPEIEAGRPVPLCLVRNKINDFVPPHSLKPNEFQKNHQVLAIAHRLHTPPDAQGHRDVDIYDPNYADEVHTLHYSKKFRLQTRRMKIIDNSLQLVDGFNEVYYQLNIKGTFRAYFKTPYTRKTPPWLT